MYTRVYVIIINIITFRLDYQSKYNIYIQQYIYNNINIIITIIN